MSDQDHLVYPGYQPLGPVGFVQVAIPIPFRVKLNGQTWQSTRYTLIKAFDEYLGMYDLVLGELLDDSVEFIFYVEPEEVEKANAIIDHIGGQ